MSRIIALLALLSLVGLATLNITRTEQRRWQQPTASPAPVPTETLALISPPPSPSPTATRTPATLSTPDITPSPASTATPDTSSTPNASFASQYQIKRVRYWLHPDRARVVFDLEPIGQVSDRLPIYELEDLSKELLVHFPYSAEVTTLEPGDQVVERITIQDSPASSTVARIELNCSVAVHPFHLSAPQRVVFDLYPQPASPDTEPKPTAEATATVPAKAPPGDWQTLEQQLRDTIALYEARVGNTIGLAITDLQTSETMSINGSERFIPGCAIKLFVWLSVLSDVQQGAYSLETSIAADSCWSLGAGEWWCGQNRKTVDQYVRDALSVSCNTANSVLTRQTGIEAVNRRMQDWGMIRSIYSHWYDLEWFKGDETAFLVYSKAEAENYLVPEEVNTVLGKLYRGEIFASEATRLAIERLTHSSSYLHHNDVIPARLPPTASIAHKYGFIPPNHLADIGIVMTESFAFAISFFSNGTSSYQAYYDAHSFGAELSKMVFDYFDNKY